MRIRFDGTRIKEHLDGTKIKEGTIDHNKGNNKCSLSKEDVERIKNWIDKRFSRKERVLDL